MAGRIRARHPPRADPAGDARGREDAHRLHGRRAGHRRPRSLTQEERSAKVERLRAEGIDPFPRDFPDRTAVEKIKAAHDPAELGEGEHPEFTYRVSGRVTGKRGHGKTAFFDVRDLTGTIQAYARVDSLGEAVMKRIDDLDIGDIVGVEGHLHVTKRGQLAIA